MHPVKMLFLLFFILVLAWTMMETRNMQYSRRQYPAWRSSLQNLRQRVRSWIKRSRTNARRSSKEGKSGKSWGTRRHIRSVLEFEWQPSLSAAQWNISPVYFASIQIGGKKHLGCERVQSEEEESDPRQSIEQTEAVWRSGTRPAGLHRWGLRHRALPQETGRTHRWLLLYHIDSLALKEMVGHLGKIHFFPVLLRVR